MKEYGYDEKTLPEIIEDELYNLPEDVDFTYISDVEVCEGVQSIGWYAFQGSDIEHVYLSDSVKGIGQCTFEKCDKLKSIRLPESLDYIEQDAFSESGLTSVTILYFADLYRKLIPDTERLYMSSLLKIPAPKYIVFYNGNSAKMPDDVIELKLSSAFEGDYEPGKFEWTATMINIRSDRDRDILNKCKPLKEYSTFVEEAIVNNQTMSIEDAVKKSVDDCIKTNVLKDFLETHRKEVVDMCLTEFDETKWC